MAQAFFEKRKFINNLTNEEVQYEAYGIRAIVDGELMEVPLKNLSAAEKIAFKMLLTGVNPSELQTSSAKSTEEEQEAFKKGITKKHISEKDENNGSENWLDELEN